MKRFPRSVVILGNRWKVKRKPLAHRGVIGLCLATRREIQIDENLPPDEQLSTLFHEVMHACLPEIRHYRTEELIVERLTLRLLPTLKGMGWIRG